MSALKVIIVDDERLARVQLAKLVKNVPQLELAAEASSGEQAIEVISSLKPDLVFLDVQMPRMTGFDVLASLEFEPRVVFVTAYDQHAVRAFEVNAVDFLMKPVSDERFSQTIERVLSAVPGSTPSTGSPGSTDSTPPLEYSDRLFLTIDRHPQFLKLTEIACVTSADDYSEIHTRAGQSTLTSQPLYHWEKRLPAANFIRIHRSALVNLDAVSSLDEQEGGGCLVHVIGQKAPLTMSRRFADQLRRRFR